LNKEDIIKIKPISIIHTDEFGDYSAIEVVKKMKIKTKMIQNLRKLRNWYIQKNLKRQTQGKLLKLFRNECE